MLLNFALFLIFSTSAVAVKEEIIIWERVKTNPSTVELINEVLRVTNDKYGEVELVLSKKFQQGEALEKLKEGKELNLVSLPPDKTKAKFYIPIEIPTGRGALGLRVCLINPEDIDLFKAIKSVSDFKKYGIKIIVGSSWPDKDIYEKNKIPIIHSEIYENLFSLTRNTPKSCFSRSIKEIESELETAKIANLVVEKTLLLKYSLPGYFYVSKNRPKFAKRIREGLEILLENKKYYHIFWKHLASSIQKLNIRKRRIINLSNFTDVDYSKVRDKSEVWLPLKI